MRKSITAERFSQINWLADTDRLISILLWLLFVAFSIFILSFKQMLQARYTELIPMAAVVVLVCLGLILATLY